MAKHVAIYLRASSNAQTTKSQEPDLMAYAAAQEAAGVEVRWYRDKATGKRMDRPGWQRLENAMRAGQVAAVVCWRVDRLGRTAKGLTALFDELCQRKVNLVSLMDGIDLGTAAGRMIANVLASIAQYETELRGERVAAGQAVARAAGKTWGGATIKKGTRVKVTPDQEQIIKQMHCNGRPITAIARATGLSRPTVYSVLGAMHNATAATAATPRDLRATA